MADKIINDLTAVSAVAAADLFEVQKSGETTTKKATLTQLTAVEAAARELADAAIRYWTGVNPDGSWPAFVNAWYLRNADYVAGIVDRAGASGALAPYGVYNALRILDAKIYAINGAKTFGSATDYTAFDAQGTLTQYGEATTFEDIYPSSVSTAGGSSAPSFTAYAGNLKDYEFVGAATMKEIHIGFQINHRYKEGSNISPHLHLFIPNDASGGTIKFGLEYTWTNIGSTGAVAPTTIYGTLVIGAGTGIYNNAVVDFADIVGTGKTISSILTCRLFRDPTDVADTFGSSVWLKSADVHIQQNTLGSNTETVK